MRRVVRLLAVVAVALAAATTAAAPALAHGGEEGLVVEPRTTSPGGALVVRGDLPTTSSVDLVLVGPGGAALPLASVEDPAQGHFETAVVIPPGTAAGTWQLQAHAGGALLAEQAVAVLPGTTEVGPATQADQAEPVTARPGSALGAVRPDAGTLQARTGADPSAAPPGPWAALAAGGAMVLACLGALVATRAVAPRKPGP